MNTKTLRFKTCADKNTGIKRLIFTCYYSIKGLKSGLQNEATFRQEFFITTCSAGSFLFDFNPVERLALIGTHRTLF